MQSIYDAASGFRSGNVPTHELQVEVQLCVALSNMAVAEAVRMLRESLVGDEAKPGQVYVNGGKIKADKYLTIDPTDFNAIWEQLRRDGVIR